MFASRQAPIKICRRHGDTERKKQNNKRLNLDTDEHRKKRFTLIKRNVIPNKVRNLDFKILRALPSE